MPSFMVRASICQVPRCRSPATANGTILHAGGVRCNSATRLKNRKRPAAGGTSAPGGNRLMGWVEGIAMSPSRNPLLHSALRYCDRTYDTRHGPSHTRAYLQLPHSRVTCQVTHDRRRRYRRKRQPTPVLYTASNIQIAGVPSDRVPSRPPAARARAKPDNPRKNAHAQPHGP